MTLLGLLLVAVATWKAARQSPCRWPVSTRRRGGWRRASMSRSVCAEAMELARLANSFNEMVGKIAEREQRITQLAFSDVLTGLPNRTDVPATA
jgi:hypothetical protein